MQYTCKESPVICGIRVYPLKKTGFSMVHYSVNQAIMTKKVSLKYKILCLRSVTSTIQDIWNTCTYKWYCISYSGCNQDVPNFTIENEQQISRVSSYMYLVWISFNKMKKSLFSRSMQMFILATVIANEHYTNHLSVN